MIEQETIRRVLDAADIVDVVKEFVTLRKAGVNYKGLCPFHQEKTPSFVVSPSKQLCKCFSCGKGGNVVHFLMEIEQMTYPEAIKWLGAKYGIEIREKQKTDEERKLESVREDMFSLNAWAAKYFQRILKTDVDGVTLGMGYFRSRGFRDDIIDKFALGFCPTQRTAMAQAAKAAGFSDKNLKLTGLCYETDRNELIDRFHGRVIFPVHTVSGKVVAFGGRILGTDKKLAKYVNSPESPIYTKSRELYGLFQAKSAIVRAGCAYLVEGYTDVISMHQCGVENVVASSGTSLTEGQIRLIHRFTEHITVLYDGDAAGIKASLRGIDMLLSEGLHIKVLLLPDGEDPDSFARSHTAEQFRAFIESNQKDFIRFKTELLLSSTPDNDPQSRAALVTDVVHSISVIPEEIERQIYVTECSRLLGVSESLIQREISKMRREKYQKRENEQAAAQPVAEQGGNIPTPSVDAQSAVTASASATVVTDSPVSPTPLMPTPGLSGRVLIQRKNLVENAENMLMSMIVRFGELTLGNSAEATEQTALTEVAEEEEYLHATVTEFIQSDLAQDELTLRSPVSRRILEEAISHVGDPNWKALPYFTLHEDLEISKFATFVSEKESPLSTHHKEQYVEEKYRLYEVIPRLLLDYKYAILREQINDVMMQLRNPEVQKNAEQSRHFMQQYMQLMSMERQFAELLGERVVIKAKL